MNEIEDSEKNHIKKKNVANRRHFNVCYKRFELECHWTVPLSESRFQAPPRPKSLRFKLHFLQWLNKLECLETEYNIFYYFFFFFYVLFIELHNKEKHQCMAKVENNKKRKKEKGM
jgi:hypothetical protein